MKYFSFLSDRVVIFLVICIIELFAAAAYAFAGLAEVGFGIVMLVIVATNVIIAYWGLLRPYAKIKRMMRIWIEQEQYEQLLEEFNGFSIEENIMLRMVSNNYSRSEMLKREIQESELLALQNQINPHFLYNTLEAIRSDAIVYGVDNIADVTESLASYFRYTISGFDGLVPLEEELGNVERYFKIQKYRFGEDLEITVKYSIDWDKRTTLYVPKMTIQPLVENAIFHGLEPSEEFGLVTIRIARTENSLLICVEDNGVGMDESRLNEINNEIGYRETKDRLTKGKKNGIALRNVHWRIQLLFGEKYGLHLMSIEGLGTKAWLTLPIRTEENLNEK